MLDISYVPNPGNACALACYTMTASYFFPGMTFDQLSKITGYEPGYVIWPFRFWLWVMDQGIEIVDYDLIDYRAWARDGLKGLRKSVSEKEFDYYVKNTKDIEGYAEDIKKVLSHQNFIYKQQKPEWRDLADAFETGAVCEVTLDSRTLDKRDGFSVHRVVVLDLDKERIVFHDPKREDIAEPDRTETIEHFKKVWLEVMDEPELCVYRKG